MSKQEQGIGFERKLIGTAFIVFGLCMIFFTIPAQEINDSHIESCLEITSESWQELCLSFTKSNSFFDSFRIIFGVFVVVGVIILVRII